MVCPQGTINREGKCVDAGPQKPVSPGEGEQGHDDDAGGIAGWAVALIVIFVLLFVALLGFVGYRFWRRKRFGGIT